MKSRGHPTGKPTPDKAAPKRGKVPGSGRKKASEQLPSDTGGPLIGIRRPGEKSPPGMEAVYPFSKWQHGETGYTRIENELIEYLMPVLKPNAWAVLCVILRKTIGYQKTSDLIDEDQIIKLTGLSQGPVRAAVKLLVAKEVIVATRTRRGSKEGPKHYQLNDWFRIEVPIKNDSSEV